MVASVLGGPLLCLQNGGTNNGDATTEEERKGNELIASLAFESPSRKAPKVATPSPKESPATPNKNNEEITFLIEVVKATIPKRRGKKDDTTKRGMHCTTTWVGPINPSGRKRRQKLLHRTKTLKIKNKSGGAVDTSTSIGSLTTSGSSDSDGDGISEELNCTEHIFTVNDASLFLFRTTMKQLVNASIKSTSSETTSSSAKTKNDEDVTDIFNSGGLRFDIFEKPLDMFNSVYSTVLADNISEKEANAITRETSSFTSYRLVGSVFLTPDDILNKCDEQRFECSLMENWRKIQQQVQQQQHQTTTTTRSLGRKNSMTTTKTVHGGNLALRIRLASKFDIVFMKTLAQNKSSTSDGVNAAFQSTLINYDGNQEKLLKPAQLITELDENLLVAETSIKAIGNISPMAAESVRYLFSNEVEKRILVKPYADPLRIEETTWFTEEGLHTECYKPSSNWIQAGISSQATTGGASQGEAAIMGGGGTTSNGSSSNSLGQVYLEVLECRGLPNTDAGGSIGNKTDAFCSVVYGDIMVQTEVIDDSCSPCWMPWSSRAFVFQIGHPSTAIHIGIADYDVGPLEHECIGRVAINLGKFHPGTLYTLTYNLYESSNLTEKGEDEGSITVRLRVEIPDEKKYLLQGWKAPEKSWVNSQQWKSHRVAKYCVDGPHDEEVFEMRLFRSHINELLTQKRYMSYAISDAMRSLIYWRGQVKVGSVYLPLHSAIVFYFSTVVVENPHLIPSFILFGCGWIMIANMLQRVTHPNPWHRGHSFARYWNLLTHGHSYREKKVIQINPLQGHKEASKLEAKWNQRLEDDDAKYAKQLELDAKIQSISDETVIRTKAKASGALVDPISAVAGAKLLPYQKRLNGYCNKVRYVRNVMNWNESIISFFTTLILFGAGFAALFVPWRFILLWTSRSVVWVFLGPWMRLFDLFVGHEETERQKAKASKKAMILFHAQRKTAKLLQENAAKMKAFRVKLFGQFITRLPEFNLTRHEDVPLPESSAEPYHSEEEIIKPLKFVPSQYLTGNMIPKTGQDAVESQARKKKEKDGLTGQYHKMFNEKPPYLKSESTPEDDLDEGFELIGTEDRVVCLHSESSDLAVSEKKESTAIQPTILSSKRDVVSSDKAIQLELRNQSQDHNNTKPATLKSSWVFSASIQLSLRKETIEKEPDLALCDESRGFIEHNIDDIAEEGVEIVPFLGSDYGGTGESGNGAPLRLENNGDHVSVFYMKDDTNQADNSGANKAAECDGKTLESNNGFKQGCKDKKNIRFKETMDEID